MTGWRSSYVKFPSGKRSVAQSGVPACTPITSASEISNGAGTGLTPVTRSDKRRPVERMGTLTAHPPALEQADIRAMNGVCSAQMLLEPSLIKGPHPASRRLIFDRPKTHDDRAHAGDLKRATQTEYAFARADLTQASVAC